MKGLLLKDLFVVSEFVRVLTLMAIVFIASMMAIDLLVRTKSSLTKKRNRCLKTAYVLIKITMPCPIMSIPNDQFL